MHSNRRFVRVLVGTALAMFAIHPSVEAAESPESLPRPVAIWPAGPIDVAVAFDRPIDPASVAKLVGRLIAFESNKPVQTGSIRVAGAGLSDEGRTLRLATDPQPIKARYKLGSWSYDLSGVEASWSEQGADPDDPPNWSGWLPVIDLEESRSLAKGSAGHDRGFALFQKAGQLTLATQAVFPRGQIRTDIIANGPIEEVVIGDESFLAEENAEPVRSQSLTVESAGEPQFLLIRLRTTADRFPTLKLQYRADNDPTPRKFTRDRLLLPWVPVAAGPTAEATVPDLTGGDPARGEILFYGDLAQCSRCHKFRGKGGEIGPDLTEIGKKGPAEIYRSIATPSAAIEPNYVSFTVSAKDGRVVAGIVRADGADAVIVNDTDAKSTRIARREIDQIRPASASIMPVGLASALGEVRIKDLIEFLMSAEGKRSIR
jgi:putative heme-binding domain-containing protein